MPFWVRAGPEMESVVPSMEIAVLSRGMKVSLAAVSGPDGPSFARRPEVVGMELEFSTSRRFELAGVEGF